MVLSAKTDKEIVEEARAIHKELRAQVEQYLNIREVNILLERMEKLLRKD